MFTWICPDCGREVPPSYTECPDCAERKKAPAAAGPTAIVPEAPAAAPRAPYLRIPELAPPPPPPPISKGGLPTWLMSIVFALAFGGLVAGAYYGVQLVRNEPASASTPAATNMETPAAASKPGVKVNPLMRQLEVAGLRLEQNKDQKMEVRFIVINHSGAEIQDLVATINLQARTRKQGEEPVGSFVFKVPLLAPYESKEVTALVDTKLKVYELPDWQNLDEQLQITSPQL
jgi:hypothetical protein